MKRDCPHSGTICDACLRDRRREAHTAAARKRRRLIAYGRYTNGLTDPGPARNHLLALRGLGIGTKRIHARTGISHSNLLDLMRGDLKRIRVTTEAAILALPLDPDAYPHLQRTESTGTMRRLQALMRIGYSGNVLAAETGIHPQTVSRLANGKQQVTARNRELVAAAYDRLWDKPRVVATTKDRLSIGQTIKAAERNGWLPPMAWDDDTIDDPAAKPHGARKRTRYKVTAEVIEDLDWLRQTGVAPEHAPARLGLTRDTLSLALRRHGATELHAWLTRKDAA